MITIESAPAPKNFMTSPGKKGYGNTTIGHLFSNPPEYISDPFERAKNQDTVSLKVLRLFEGRLRIYLHDINRFD